MRPLAFLPKLICSYILLPTELHLKNVYYLYNASSNPTNVVRVIVLEIAWVITHRSNLAVPISSILAYNHTQDNISEIRTRAIEIVNVFEMDFRWKKDITHIINRLWSENQESSNVINVCRMVIRSLSIYELSEVHVRL